MKKVIMNQMMMKMYQSVIQILNINLIEFNKYKKSYFDRKKTTSTHARSTIINLTSELGERKKERHGVWIHREAVLPRQEGRGSKSDSCHGDTCIGNQ